MLIDPEFMQRFDEAVMLCVKRHNIAIETLTERQSADVFKQAILAGDFKTLLIVGEDKQSVIYVPGMGNAELRSENENLRKRIEELEESIKRKESDALEAGEYD